MSNEKRAPTPDELIRGARGFLTTGIQIPHTVIEHMIDALEAQAAQLKQARERIKLLRDGLMWVTQSVDGTEMLLKIQATLNDDEKLANPAPATEKKLPYRNKRDKFVDEDIEG